MIELTSLFQGTISDFCRKKTIQDLRVNFLYLQEIFDVQEQLKMHIYFIIMKIIWKILDKLFWKSQTKHWGCILFTLSGKSIHLAGKVYKFFLDLVGKLYTFPTDKKRIIFLCGKLGKVDKFLVFHIRILYTFIWKTYCLPIGSRYEIRFGSP